MITSKRILAATLVAALGLTAAACGDDEETTSTTAAAADDPATTMAAAADDPATTMAADAAEGTNVGLLFDITGRGDKSFNDSAAAGLDRAAAELGIIPSESAPTGDDDRVPRLNLFVDDQKDIIVGVGFLWSDAIAAAAAANPDMHFAIVDSVVDVYNNATPDDTSDDVALGNVASLVFAANEGSFLVGAAAALESKTGIIGYFGGVDFPLLHEFEAGYVAGAKSVNPDIEIISQYGSVPPDFAGFTDTAKAKEIGLQMYAEGADVIFHAAGQAGNGIFEAAAESGAPGEVWAIGVDQDQYPGASAAVQPYILTSMVKRVDNSVFETIKAETEGTFTPGLNLFNLENDGVGYATSGDFLQAETITKLEELKAQIIAGEIEVPIEREGT